MSNLHPIFEDIVNAFTGLPASVSGHIVAAAASEAPDHGSPDRNMVAAENLSAAASTGPCVAEMNRLYAEADAAYRECLGPILRSPSASAIDAALRSADDDYEPEVEEEVDRRREDDRIAKYGMTYFIPFGLIVAMCGLLAPASPTPIDDSLPSSGLHDAGRTTNPAPVTDGWRGFLWTT